MINFAKCNRFQNYTEAILLQSVLQIVFILKLTNTILEKFIFSVSAMTVHQLEAVHTQLSEIILVTENSRVGGALKTTQARNSEMLIKKIADHGRKIQKTQNKNRHKSKRDSKHSHTHQTPYV